MVFLFLFGYDCSIGFKLPGCGYNCHKNCMKNVPKNCGINEKMMSEILSTIKKDGSQKGLKPSKSNEMLLTAAFANSLDLKNSNNKNDLTSNDIDTLKMREIAKLSFERKNKKSEKLNANAANANRAANSNNKTLNDDSDDYIDLKDCYSKKITLKDFNLVKLVGKGSFGKVFLVTSKATNDYFAMKALKKDVVLQDDDVECTMLERDVCRLGNRNPYLTKLFCTFQNEVSRFESLFSSIL